MKKIFLIQLFTCCFCYCSLAQKTDTITTASGLKYFWITRGTGPAFKPGYIAIQHYILTLSDGTKVDNTRERNMPFVAQYPSKRLISGSNEALLMMHIGDRGIFIMPPDIAYGKKGRQGIPPNATLVFDIELLDMREKSLETVLDSVLFGRPVRTDSIPHTAEAVKTFKRLKKAKFENLYVSEDALNDLGYQIIKKYPADAVALFKLNVKLYPASGNAFDSLAEGYMDAGNNRLAIKYYQKSLKLNPKNTNAAEMIKKIKSGEGKASE